MSAGSTRKVNASYQRSCRTCFHTWAITRRIPSTFSRIDNCGSACLNVHSMAKNGQVFRSPNNRLSWCNAEKGSHGKPHTDTL